jgi:HicA toxin of bacterial toxin-antitoxin,
MLDEFMNNKHAKTLKAVFKSPTPSALEWQAIENLLVAVGCEVIEGSGSRVRFARDGIVASFHRPHPEKEAKRYQVRDARDYLIAIGEEP